MQIQIQFSLNRATVTAAVGAINAESVTMQIHLHLLHKIRKI